MPESEPVPMPKPAMLACSDCGTQVAPGLLICPGCHRLVHAERLKQLADEAGRAEHPPMRSSPGGRPWNCCRLARASSR